MATSERRKIVLDTVEDLVAKLLYYDRKVDDELPVGSIEAAIASGETTEAEIAETFSKELSARLAEGRQPAGLPPLETGAKDG